MAWTDASFTPVRKVFRRDSIEFVPLLVKINGVATILYKLQAQPHGTDSDLAGTWNDPDSATPDTGYRVNGPVLGGGSVGEWDVFLKITDSPQAPVRLPLIIRLV